MTDRKLENAISICEGHLISRCEGCRCCVPGADNKLCPDYKLVDVLLYKRPDPTDRPDYSSYGMSCED